MGSQHLQEAAAASEPVKREAPSRSLHTVPNSHRAEHFQVNLTPIPHPQGLLHIMPAFPPGAWCS